MAFDKTNTGILSRNDRREKETHPEFRGEINVDGTDYWLSAWVKEKKDGSGRFFSLSVRPKEEKTSKPAAKSQRLEDMDSDLPF